MRHLQDTHLFKFAVCYLIDTYSKFYLMINKVESEKTDAAFKVDNRKMINTSLSKSCIAFVY